MKNLITSVVLSVAAHGAVLYPLALKADGECVANVRASATQEYHAARVAFVRVVAGGVRQQVAVLGEVGDVLTADDKMLLVAAPDNEVLPDALAEKIKHLEDDYFSVLCQYGEETENGEDGIKCVGEINTYEDAPYPLVLRELFIEAGMVYSCTEYVSRDGVVPTIDAYSCSALDLESGEVFGRRPLTSIDRDHVSPQVFAYVDDVSLHETLEHFIKMRMAKECGQ